MRAHNAIRDRRNTSYPGWSDDLLVERARHQHGADGEIHTIDWNSRLGPPGMADRDAAHWFGLAGDHIKALVKSPHSCAVLGGIPDSPAVHSVAPYSFIGYTL
jgi:hypothetical protein